MEAPSISYADVEARPECRVRLALFTGAYTHIADGVSLTLNRLVRHLEGAGHDVLVVAPTVDDPAVADHAGRLVPAPSVAAPGRKEYRISLGLPRAVRQELKAFGPTLVHVATPDVLGHRALALAKRWGVPAVASYHTHFSSYLKYYNLGALEPLLWAGLRRFYAQCEHVYVPTRSMADVLHHHGIDEGLRLWERGVDTHLFNPDRRSMSWRQSVGAADDEVLVTFVGRLVWEKNLGLFADVVEALEAQGIRHRSLIVGDGPARADLERRLPETVFMGHLGGEALARAYASSDVFFFPSDTETFGNVTLEAMASGLPCVVADATGSASLVDHGRSGFRARPGDTAEFLDAVARLVQDPALRYRMGEVALADAQSYEWSAVLGRLEGYYREVLQPQAVPCGDGALQAHHLALAS